MKDLFCPFREQRRHMEVGRKYIVYVKLDEESYRLMATAKIERYLKPASLTTTASLPSTASAAVPAAHAPAVPADPASASSATASLSDSPASGGFPKGKSVSALSHSTPVDVLIWQKTDLGFKCIVNNSYQGLIYDNQVFQPLKTGDRLTAYVDHVRQDGKIDITLQPTGHRHTLDFAEQLLRYLHENDGQCPLGDHSPAEAIQATFNVSKKTFKKAVGDLYRRQLIIITDEGISLK
jgi:predicted RNA-binding protein (virulence factor B family)